MDCTVSIITPIESESGREQEIERVWAQVRVFMSRQEGFMGARLFRSLDAKAKWRYYGMSEWSSEDTLRAAVAKLLLSDLPGRNSIAYHPELYERIL